MRVQIDGKPVEIGTWEQYCDVVEGRSREAVDEDLRNLQAFGEQLLEVMQQMGFGYKKLRELRTLPEDARGELIEAAQTGDKEAIVEAADALIRQHAKERGDWLAREAEVRKSVAAKDRLIEERCIENNELRERLNRPYTPNAEAVAQSAEEEALLTDLRDAVNEVERVTRRLSLAAATAKHKSYSRSLDMAADQALEYCAQLVADVFVANGLRPKFEEMAKPAWTTAAIAQALRADAAVAMGESGT